MSDAGASPWADAVQAAALVAMAPHRLGGVALRAPPGSVRTRWLDLMGGFREPAMPLRRLPVSVTEGRLLGELDLAATLAANRPCAARGLLPEADGGIVIAAMAERLSAATVAHLGAALDRGAIRVERDGFGLTWPAAIGVVALDEGMAPEETVATSLRDRLAIWLDLTSLDIDPDAPSFNASAVAAARRNLPQVEADEPTLQALCAGAWAIGADSLRAPLLALAVARCAAALAGRFTVAADDLALAVRLVLAPRATRLPTAPDSSSAEPPSPEQADGETASSRDSEGERGADNAHGSLEDRVIAAAAAAIPADLLAKLAARGGSKAKPAGRSGVMQRGKSRGRPVGARAGVPRHGARLDLIATLRAAAPWQPLRRREAAAEFRDRPRVIVRTDDFRIKRFKQQVEQTTVFVVDASGSAAVQRLSEAKGAVELLLAECYIRRDEVALLTFRRTAAELLLPPTRALARVKRSLASLPGGGGTPLAAGLEAAAQLAATLRAKGRAVRLVMLTDGRGNVARDGSTGRAAGEADALSAAKLIRASGAATLLVDTASRPQAAAQAIAKAMGASYLPLPHADAARLAGAVQAAMPS